MQLDKELATFKPQAAAAAVAAFDASPASLDKAVERLRLPGGAQLSLLAKPTRGQAVQGALTLHLGSLASLKGQPSVSELVAGMLKMGTLKRDRQQLRDALDAAKVELNVDGSRPDQVRLIWSTKREHAVTALALIAEMLREPHLEAAALEELRAQGLTGIQAQRDEPQALAPLAANLALNKHERGDPRHARNFDEQAADLKAVTQEQLRAFHAKHYGAAAAELSLVGDFDAAAIKQTAASALGNWAAPQAYQRIADAAVEKAGRVQLLSTPDKQNAMMFGVLALPLTDPACGPGRADLANHLLGGGMSSRLWLRIREKDGLSYGVGSGIQWDAQDPESPWFMYAIFAPQNRAKVEAALREEVARALSEGFTAKEVAEGKQALLSARKLRLSDDANLANLGARNLELNRNFARQQQIDVQIAQLTPEAVNAALRKHFKLDSFQLVFAGDFK